MKNILDSQTKEEIFQRIDKLTLQSKAQWGKMNVNQGLRHMAMAFQIPTGELQTTIVNPPKIPKWLLKFFLLNMKPPKSGAETFKETNMVGTNTNPEDFDAEKINLKNKIEKFIATNNLIPENQFVGKFSRNDWGKLNYNHTDHHLRQFGV